LVFVVKMSREFGFGCLCFVMKNVGEKKFFMPLLRALEL